ncbi:MAG: right-handed parallel beta-helix repeat-containing protein, partial [Thermodesulfobacteriota bacterium]|nr:right-handed parallel beta-helix repeat-containing protein [Thermodesulfobacteriota bacterium]
MKKRGNQNVSSRAMWCAVLTLALSASMAPQAGAATITVDGTTCTLADAITSANTDTETEGCLAGSGADIIDLQTNVTLDAALPRVTTEVTIAGNNHIISGNDTVRVLYNDGGDLTIKDTTISGGSADAGAGIRNHEGNLTLDNCTVSGNAADDDGGGISNYSYYGSATVTVTDSTISGNVAADDGGGIFNYSYYGSATVTVTDSTISGNTAENDGGGIYNYTGDGTAPLTVTTSTISGNMAENDGGGIYNYTWDGTAPLTVTTSTISGNMAENDGGGIFSRTDYGDADLTLKGNLISGNTAANDGAELFNGSRQISLHGGYNLLGQNGIDTAAAFSGIDLSPTDVRATSDSANPFALNAILGPLAENGGATMTHALLA